MQNKILGKYTILNSYEKGKILTRYNNELYIIESVQKDEQNALCSYTAQNLSSVLHKNISNILVEEDKRCFYLIKRKYEDIEKLDADFFKDRLSLIKCYQQIILAISYIHQKDFYHGNINPENILVDCTNNVYLLDFGKSYLYSLLKKDCDKRFYAPEQLEQNETSKESDIYSFGLCMLKLIVDSYKDFDFFEIYTSPKDLEKLFQKIYDDYELDELENELFIIAKGMVAIKPENRTSLQEVSKKLKDLLKKYQAIRTFEIKLNDNVVDRYKEEYDVDLYDVANHIEEKLANQKTFWSFGEDKNGREEIKIAINNMLFCCSARNDDKPYLFCFKILDNQRLTEELYRHGVETNYDFTISHQYGRASKECDDVREFIDELKEKFKHKQLLDKQLEIDKKSIATEEELLEAEYKAIQEKKNTKFAILKEINKGKDEINFELIDDENDDETKDDDNFLNLNDNDSNNANDEKYKNFKQGQKVIMEAQRHDISLSGEVVCYKPDIKILTIKMDKYETNNFKKDNKYKISYDYQVEEIIWNKRNKALEALKSSMVVIPNLIRKINSPNEFIKNDLIDILKWSNEKLDENQKQAVVKSLSLGDGCEILLIQGPPGTGKTTTITEIVSQILQTKKHSKILVSSQSNQAVDNVLEKICKDEDKILRIGNDASKMSKEAQKFMPEKVLNKLISQNLKRIKENSIIHEDKNIQKELIKLQEDFAKRLQSITSKLATKKDTKESELATLFLKNIRLIFGTLIGISSWQNFKEMTFDIAIVDEAGRATLSELLVPCIKAKTIVLVGDHKQLAPVIDDEVIEKVDDKGEVKISFFQRFFERLEKVDRENLKHILTYNYRSERKICELYSNAFYEGELIVSDDINKYKQHEISFFKSSVVWLDTANLNDKEDEQKGTGKINRCNAKYIKNTIGLIYDNILKNNLNYDIGIITPYKAQKELLDNTIRKSDFDKIKIDIGTVDSFQGSDRDIIIYDCVRSSKSKAKRGQKIDFIADEKRLNVSLSRAKKLLIIIGDMEFLYTASVSGEENPFISIINHIKGNEEYEIINLGKNSGKTKK
ncbi:MULTISPECIES: AAA domain-containing protein [Campylobacter]|uniref:AAA domain-containing protein n=1 Tax=Campylobacter TaxID=194 RepID=UPI001470069F|nr:MULTISPECIES: AAA domain-containing protein [Campylobacter]MBN7287343.1 protein kinase [Campylobacter curvus]MDU6826745.1 AAA domain-containing protein [Campylobacter sp.]